MDRLDKDNIEETAAEHHADCGEDGKHGGDGRRGRRRAPASPEELVLAAAAIAITVSRDKSIDELQTLLNLFSTTADLLDSILKQRLINKAFEVPFLGIDLSTN